VGRAGADDGSLRRSPLLVGLPGLAKTKLVETMGIVLGLDARRIQFTPDLMPSDIVGSEVLEEAPGGKRSFASSRPIFAQLLMATRSTAPAHHPVGAVAGDAGAARQRGRQSPRRAASVPRACDAESDRAGRHLSPAEAQLDRFLMQIDVPYPDLENERKIHLRHHRRRREQAKADAPPPRS